MELELDAVSLADSSSTAFAMVREHAARPRHRRSRSTSSRSSATSGPTSCKLKQVVLNLLTQRREVHARRRLGRSLPAELDGDALRDRARHRHAASPTPSRSASSRPSSAAVAARATTTEGTGLGLDAVAADRRAPRRPPVAGDERRRRAARSRSPSRSRAVQRRAGRAERGGRRERRPRRRRPRRRGRPPLGRPAARLPRGRRLRRARRRATARRASAGAAAAARRGAPRRPAAAPRRLGVLARLKARPGDRGAARRDRLDARRARRRLRARRGRVPRQARRRATSCSARWRRCLSQPRRPPRRVVVDRRRPASTSTSSRRSLAPEGYARRCAPAAARRACELVRRELPAVVVLDLLMPGVDGFAVVERLRADPADGGRADRRADGEGHDRAPTATAWRARSATWRQKGDATAGPSSSRSSTRVAARRGDGR